MNNLRINFQSKRFYYYPIAILITVWSIVGINIFNHNGWQGGFGQIIGSDFITLHSAGLIYKTNISHLYDLESQEKVQQAMIQPTTLEGLNPYISPPYVALGYSVFTNFSLLNSFIFWSVLSLVFVFLTSILLINYLNNISNLLLISQKQMLIILLSFFPLVQGWQVGQNHTLSLLLITGIVYFTKKNRPLIAGILAGLMMYKPQFILGFIILWIIWGNYKSLISFGIISLIWIAVPIIQHGFLPYEQYLTINNYLLYLPYIPGFPGYLLTTLYGLLATTFPPTASLFLRYFSIVLLLTSIISFTFLAFYLRKNHQQQKDFLLLLAILFPFIATPYALFHDLVILFPWAIIWVKYSQTRLFLVGILLLYFGGLILPILSYTFKIALLAIIPLFFFICITYQILTNSFIKNNNLSTS